MIFDSHAHYDDEAFNADREEVLSSLRASGASRIVNVGASAGSTLTSYVLSRTHDFIYSAAGIHPSDVTEYETSRVSDEDLETVRKFEQAMQGDSKTAKLASELHLTDIADKLASTAIDMDWLVARVLKPKVVAVGEIGLDYYWDEPDRDIQKKWFCEQLAVAKELEKPIIIHSRDAAKDTLDIMRDMGGDQLKAVIHCFSYEPEVAREFLKMGYYIGIGGVLTYKNARKQKEVLAEMPLDRLLLETDCPYLTPTPHRGERNYSGYLPLVVSEMSKIRDISEDEIERITYENACRFYEIKK